jgi:dethiobiotin synthetase
MSVLVVTGTGTGVGKTVVTAALAALAPSVTVVKPAQTGVAPGEPGDLDDVVQRAGAHVRTVELARYPDPLSPEAAARRSGLPVLERDDVVHAVRACDTDLVLVEGAGGLLVRFSPDGLTLADVAAALDAPVLVVTTAGLGTLNTTSLTLEAMAARGLVCAGLVVGSWPADPDLAARSNVHDLRAMAPLVGVVPEGAAGDPGDWLAPAIGGRFDAEAFAGSVA